MISVENLILAIYDESTEVTNSKEQRDILTDILQALTYRESYNSIKEMIEEINEAGFY